jgi:SAM-dependent methyltransferase
MEAAVLAQEFQAEVVGIDLDSSIFDPAAGQAVDLRIGDATRLDFNDDQFDLVYSFHVLEHIPLFREALSEMARVLRPEGVLFVGVPNRARWIGYLGSEHVNWRKKVEWNWEDWKSRMQGKFKNEFGAHAGYLSQELKAELKKIFEQPEEITLDYYLERYRKYSPLIHLLDWSGLSTFLFPAIFFMARK